jgi:predicted HAD superfamily Cof-like phosphohydrolase
MDEIFTEIHQSNMTKVGGYKDESGKWIKPENYVEPDFSSIL